MANKTILVATREYIENVRTKTFLIGIFIVPIILAVVMGISVLLQQFKETKTYTVVDLGSADLVERAEREARKGDAEVFFEILADAQRSGAPGLAELVQEFQGQELGTEPSPAALAKIMDWMQRQSPTALARFSGIQAGKKYDYVQLEDLELGAPDQPQEELRQRLNQLVNSGKLFAYFVLGPDPTRSSAGFDYVSNNLTDSDLRTWYERALTTIVQQDRIEEAGIPSSVARHIQEPVRFEKGQVSETGERKDVKQEDQLEKWAPVGFVYLLFIAIFTIANMLLTNTIEEKSNRVIEVLLSSVSPGELMAGKVWGIAATGMTVIGAWITFGLLAAWLAPKFLGEDMGTVVRFLVTALTNHKYLLAFVLYFVSGYLLYAAILVAIGSVCSTLKEAQNLMQPVMIVLMIPLVAMVFITQEPNGTVAKVMSFIPLFTPFTMMNRAGGPPETWEYVVTSVLLLASIWFVFKAAGKVFRVGVLMTGNPPKLKEILGWLREK